MDSPHILPQFAPHASPPEPGRVSMWMIVLVSLFVGGVSGGTIGTLTSNGGLAKILNKNSSPSASVQNIGTGTVKLTEESATVDVVKKVSPAVVSIIANKDFSKVYGNQSQGVPDNFFNFPFLQQLPQGLQTIGSGSGFIVSSDGVILTNKHVATIDGTDQFKVIMNDGKSYDASVLATDPSTDIAFMKIDAKDLPTIELGNSDTIQIGDTVIAIGNALGEYRNTVTKGIISGLARTITAGDGTGNSETLHNVIQTDAAINQGNSGGPLLNIAGQAIGINTAIDSQGQLVGFSIPINVAKTDLTSVQKTGKIDRPFLGIRYVIVNDTVKEQKNLSVNYGALVVSGSGQSQSAVVSGSPADKAGIVENDIILEIDGKKIDENYDLSQALLEHSVGQTVTLKILSQGQEKTVSVKLETRSQ